MNAPAAAAYTTPVARYERLFSFGGLMNLDAWIKTVKEADAGRPDLPARTLIVLGVGLLLLMATGRSRSC
jgi:hypothetical protein